MHKYLQGLLEIIILIQNQFQSRREGGRTRLGAEGGYFMSLSVHHGDGGGEGDEGRGVMSNFSAKFQC